MENHNLPGFGQLWNETWGIYKEKNSKLLIFSIPLLLVNLLSFVLLSNNASWYAVGVSYVLSFLVFMFSQAAFFGSLVNNNESFGVALNDSPKYIWTTILQSSIVLCGFALLVVPGIIWSIWMTLSPVIIADHKVDGLQALAWSREYMRGQVMTIFVKIFLFSLIVGIPSTLLEGLGEKSAVFGFFAVIYGVFVAQVVAVYMYNLYRHVKAGKPEISPNVNWMKNAAIGGAVLAVALVLVSGVLYYKFQPEINKAFEERNESPVENTLGEPQGAEEGL